MAFSCGARSASELREQDYLRNMLSRRQLQGFVRRRRLTALAIRFVFFANAIVSKIGIVTTINANIFAALDERDLYQSAAEIKLNPPLALNRIPVRKNESFRINLGPTILEIGADIMQATAI
jgi:hypothetical protein